MIMIEVNSERWMSLENLPNESWKEVKNYEGFYAVSSCGRVKRLNHTITFKDGRIRRYKEKILRLNSQNGRYYSIVLWKQMNKIIKDVHRLVAEHFLDNPHNYKCVNHKDRNTFNNSIANLEWCTHSYNITYDGASIRNGLKRRNNESTSKPIQKLSLSGEVLESYPSIREAARQLGNVKKDCNILRACKGEVMSSYGFKWRYVQ